MKKWFIIGLLVCMLSVSFMPVSQAIDLGNLGGLIKVAGIALLVDKYGPELNDLINKLFDQNNVGTDYATKVVPIITAGVIGDKSYIGAAQVMGSQELVDRVQAVVQIESTFNGSMFRIKALVPSETKDPTNFKRVTGVGVSATIDVRI
jgi:hypothetical protein